MSLLLLVFVPKLVPFLELSIDKTLTVPKPVALSALLTINLSSNTAAAERYLGHADVGMVPTPLYIVVPPPAWTPPVEVIDAPPTAFVEAEAEAALLTEYELLTEVALACVDVVFLSRIRVKRIGIVMTGKMRRTTTRVASRQMERRRHGLLSDGCPLATLPLTTSPSVALLYPAC